MKKIALFTGNRAEYGLQIPILRAIKNNPNLDYILIVSGAHLDPDYGKTLDEIESDGFTVHEKIDIGKGDTNLVSTSYAIANGIKEITKIIEERKPDIFVVYADRYESFSAAIAASQTNTVTLHVEGGDLTEGGALDDSVRHAMTKLSHIHCVSNEDSHKRILSLGEESWRIHTVGYPAIDLINNSEFYQPDEIQSHLDIDIEKPIIIFTQHSVTNKFDDAKKQLEPSLNAISKVSQINKAQCIITYPNNDAGGEEIYKTLNEFSSKNQNIILRKSLGRELYWGLLNLAKEKHKVVCVGNSSSGIKETPAFGCPTVNIGTRQEGRLRGENIIDTDYNKDNIYKAIYKCLFDKAFREICGKCKNPYGMGGAGEKIIKLLLSIENNDKILTKKMMR
jgi:UDP-hydrolysing UDP-N-acetyl-D-glucosamine 2-epimerase